MRVMSHVRREQNGDITILHIDDGKANALSASMIEQLGQAIREAEGEAKALVLHGREGRFCAGFDMKIMMGGAAAVKDLLTVGCELFLQIYGLPLPVVAACTGHAVAGGALLAGCADRRIGAEGAFKIGLNEHAIGMPLPIFAHALAHERLAPSRRVEATLGARIYTPAEAVEVGWLDRVVAPDRVLEEAIGEAKQLAKLHPPAFAFSKKSIRQGLIEHVRTTLASNLTEMTAHMGLS